MKQAGHARPQWNGATGWWELTAAALLAYLAGPSPIGVRLAQPSLAVHMLIEHLLLVAAGALAALGIARLIPTLTRLPQRAGGAAAATAVLLVGFWHLPAAFDAALANVPVHAVMHLSYVAAGFALMLGVPRLSPFGRMVLCLGAQSLMGVLALAMISGALVYAWYPPAQSTVAGAAMFVAMQMALPIFVVWPHRLRVLTRPA